MKAAKEQGYLDANPSQGLRLPPREPVLPRITYKPEDVRRLLDALPEEHRVMAMVAALTGMRASELVALTWDDVDLDKAVIHVRRSFYKGQFGPPKSKSSQRAIPISEGLLTIAQLHRVGRHAPGDLNLVFPNAVGKPYEPNNLVQRVLKPTMRRLGLPETGWRSFRRSVATALSESREPVKAAQQQLGHSSPEVTLAVYTQSVEESQRQAINRLEQLMFPNVPKFKETTGSISKLVN